MRNPFRRTRGRHRSGTVTVDDLLLRRCADKPDPFAALLSELSNEGWWQVSAGRHQLGRGHAEAIGQQVTVGELEASATFLDGVTYPWVTFRRGPRVGARDFPEHQPPITLAELAEIRDGWGGFGARYNCEVDADAPYAPHIPPPQKGDTVGVEIDGNVWLQPYDPRSTSAIATPMKRPRPWWWNYGVKCSRTVTWR